MVTTMTDIEKQKELLSRRGALVDSKLKELSDKELEEFERALRTYMFVRDKLRWTKKSLIALNKSLDANQTSLLMAVITRENYKSNQDYLRMITLELKQEFYEFELEKIGIDYVPYQKEWELVTEEFNNQKLSEEEQEENKTLIDLYSASLKIKILQRMGYSFA
jgi:hypothetical protein